MAGGSLDDLNFEIKGNISTTMESLKELGRQLDGIFQQVDKIDANFRNLGHAMGLPAEQIELLSLRIQPLVNKLTEANKKATALEESFTRKLMARAMEEHNKKVVTLADGTQRARYEMIRLADASQQLRIPTQMPRPQSPVGQSGGGGVNFVRVTAAAAQLTMLARASATMRTVGQSVAAVGRSSTVTADAMTRFRMGLNAVPVNPALNVVKNGLDAVGSGAANAIDKLRGVADAILSDLPGAAAAAVGAVGNVNSALDSASATASKHVANLQRMQGSLNLLATVFPFAADAIARFRAPLDVVTAKAESVTDKLDEMNASVGTAAAEIRGKAYVMTGAWTQLAGSADLFGRSQYYALLPQRLLMREFEGGQRIVKVATHAYNLLTHPIHAVSLALGQSRAEWRDLNARLPKATGGLQLATRAQRLFGQSAYMVGSAVRSVVTILTPVARLSMAAGRGIWSMIGPAKNAAASIARLTGVQNTFIGKALGMKPAADDAAASLAKIDKAAAKASGGGGLGGMISKAFMIKTALVAGAVAMVGFSASTAMATEKNNAIFGTMLHDMEQGAAVVQSLQGTKAAGLFDNQELLDSGRLLFKARVSAKDLAGKTDQLAKIAIGTSTELGDLTRIYQQGANAGAFQQDKINQLAERGIAIYDGLTHATGKSGEELKKMISDGKIGITEMDSALAYLTTGTGYYANALEDVGNTSGGMMSQIKNNLQQAFGSLAGPVLAAFKPILAIGVTWSASMKNSISSLQPVMAQAGSMIASALGAIGSIGRTIFGGLFSGGQWAFGAILDKAMVFFTTVKFGFDNFGAVAKFGWDLFTLYAVTAFEKIKHFFLVEAPAYLKTFGLNMKNLLSGNAMIETIVPERALTALELQLAQSVNGLGDKLRSELDAKIREARELLNQEVKPPEIKDTGGGKTGEDGSAAAANAARKAAENRAVGVRSAEGQSVVAQMQKLFGKGDKEKKAQDAQIAALQELKDIKNDARRRKQIAAGPGF
jgi:tape measure domain-containing protein